MYFGETGQFELQAAVLDPARGADWNPLHS